MVLGPLFQRMPKKTVRTRPEKRKPPHINSRGSYRFPTLRAINWHLWLNNGELRVMTESKADGCVPRYGVFFNRFIEQDIPDVGPLTRPDMMLWAHNNLGIEGKAEVRL